MMKKLASMALLSLGVATAFQTLAQTMDHHPTMDHGNMGAVKQGEASGAAQGRGVINSVDPGKRSVNITHDPIPALSWPSMTMDLPVTERVDLGKLKRGGKVDFKLVLGADNVYRINQVSAAH